MLRLMGMKVVVLLVTMCALTACTSTTDATGTASTTRTATTSGSAGSFVHEAPDRALVCFGHRPDCDGNLERDEAQRLAATLNALPVAETEGDLCPPNGRAVFVLATFWSGDASSVATVGLPCANAGNDRGEWRVLTDEVLQQLREHADDASA
jgi:hypothetical protein